MKFKGCGVQKNKNTFVHPYDLHKYSDGVIAPILFLEGTVLPIPDVSKRIPYYDDRWIRDGLMPTSFDFKCLCMQYYEGNPSPFEHLQMHGCFTMLNTRERNGKGPQQMHQLQSTSQIESTNQLYENSKPVLGTPTNMNRSTIMQLCMQQQISPAHEYNTNNSTDDLVLGEQLDSASDNGSGVCAGDTYLPIHASDNVVGETYNPNFIEGD